MIERDRIGSDSVVRVQDVTCEAMSDKAILVTGEAFGAEKLWIPLSQVHDDSEVYNDSDRGCEGELVVTQWIAEKKGLI